MPKKDLRGAPAVSVVVDIGFTAFYCPVCGSPVFTIEGCEEGHCRHVRYFIDWNDEMFLADPDLVPESWRESQRALLELWQKQLLGDDAEFEGFGAFIQQSQAILPASALILDLQEPGRGAAHTGSSCVVCIGFDDQALPQ